MLLSVVSWIAVQADGSGSRKSFLLKKPNRLTQRNAKVYAKVAGGRLATLCDFFCSVKKYLQRRNLVLGSNRQSLAKAQHVAVTVANRKLFHLIRLLDQRTIHDHSPGGGELRV